MGTTPRTVAVECDGFALCSDVLELGWIAVTPCGGCVIAAAANDLEPAATEGPRDANRAQIVTGDELERLLSRVRQSGERGRTSSH